MVDQTTPPQRHVRDAELGTPSRPSWRGRIHLIALFTALPLVVALAINANGALARAGVIVYAVGLCSTLGVSTIYHRWVHTIRARTVWRRLDHATIFTLIAGTCTALALTSLRTGHAIAMLIVVWLAALAGALLKLVWFDRAERVGPLLYIAIGWSGAALFPAIWWRAGPVSAGSFAAGGVVYTVGAIAFARQWPAIRSSRFSYHEVWHTFTVAAAALHFATVTTLTT